MRNTNKKGFTIVELVVVVAVIAILAAVLIPTFSGIIKKAQYSADQKAVREMNNAIAMESATTLEDAIAALEKHGINAEHLIPISAGYSFIWNETEHKIELVEGKVDESVEEAKKNIAVAVNTADAFVEAVNSDLKYIKLEADIVLDQEIKFTTGNVTLDLGGFKCTTEKTNAGEISQTSKYIKVSKGASLTIQNGTFEGRGIMNEGNLTIKAGTIINAVDVNGGACINNKTGGTVTIEGGTFNVPNYIAYEDVNKGGANGVKNDGGTVVIKAGTFKSNTDAYLIANVSGTMIIDGGTFESFRGVLHAAAGTLTVNNGTFTAGNSTVSGWTAYAAAKDLLFIKGGTFTSTNVSKNNIHENVNQ